LVHKINTYLKTTELHRWLIKGPDFNITPKLRFPFRDETSKITIVKYILKGVIGSNLINCENYLYRLDARSIRYMRRVKIIENRKGESYEKT
jgi:hypothetical protein